MVYAILGMGFIPVAILRYRMAVSNAKRFVAMEEVQSQQASSITLPEQPAGQEQQGTDSPADQAPAPVQTVLRESFVTAGSIVAAATALVGFAEVALLVLILRV